MPFSSAPKPPDGGDSTHAGPWARFVRRHLFDYKPAATRAWLLLAAVGSLATVWALVQLAQLPWADWARVQLAVGLVAAAACFPVHLPRTRYSLGVADVFVLAILALYGVPAATLAAAVEGLVGAWRSSKRLTSRISTPAAASASTATAGLLYEALLAFGVARGLSHEAAILAALTTASLPYFAGTTLPLLGVMALKNDSRLSLREWAAGYSWLAAIDLASAVVAGVLVINARQFGAGVIGVAVVSAAALVALTTLSLRRHEAERSAQDSLLAAARLDAQRNQQRFTTAFTHAAVGMAIVLPDGSMQQVNQALCRLLGHKPEQLLQQPFSALLHPGDAALFRRRVRSLASSTAQDNEAFSMELRCRDGAGHDLWVSLHCSHFTDPSDDRRCLIYQLHDITSRRLAEDRLHHTAYHDSLTDLANRSCFNARLAVAVDASSADAGAGFAVMFLDLDRFKVVNDRLGHSAGNALLCEVARRLSDGVRPGDLVARLGGDEFAVLAERLADPEAALALGQRLLQGLQQPMLINGTEVQPGASIGITCSDLGYRSADEILRDADLAMYAAKADGRSRVKLFDQSMHERMAEKLALESALRRAIGEGQLSVAYQPLYDLEPYRLSGFEALARWVHPERGHISPAVFIALAEESGHIEALTQWVIDQAVGQLAAWRSNWPQLQALDMHVNISGRDLANPALVPQVRDALLHHGLDAHALTLEITEPTLMGNLSTALDALQTLRKMGVRFSIDDFGTGYSSLAHLSTLPIDSLKIDSSFVTGMDEAPQNVEIVRAVCNLGLSLGKKVIAEGIETMSQLATLKTLGVHVGQGYLLSRPLRAEQVPALLAAMAAASAVQHTP